MTMLQQYIKLLLQKLAIKTLLALIFLFKRVIQRIEEREEVVEGVEELIEEEEEIALGSNEYRVSLTSVLYLAKYKGPQLTKVMNTTGRWQDAIHK